MKPQTQGYVLPWDDASPTGEGLTRTTDPKARLWSFRLTFNGAPPMRCTVRALTLEQAEGFIRHRHPNVLTMTIL